MDTFYDGLPGPRPTMNERGPRLIVPDERSLVRGIEEGEGKSNSLEFLVEDKFFLVEDQSLVET